MAKYRRLEVLNGIMESGLIPIFYHEELSVAQHITEACAGGGATVIEFTNRGDRACRLSCISGRTDPTNKIVFSLDRFKCRIAALRPTELILRS